MSKIDELLDWLIGLHPDDELLAERAAELAGLAREAVVALEDVEWVEYSYKPHACSEWIYTDMCPWCEEFVEDGHASWCRRQKVLRMVNDGT